MGHAWALTEVLTEAEEGGHAGRGLYTCSRCNETKEARLCAGEVFTDMPEEGNWAHAPIDWAFFNGITVGKTSTIFAPKAPCTRGEVVTFLWRAAGKPEPETDKNPFSDVKEGSYYYKAVLWAVEQGITKGKTSTIFAPKATCTRGEAVTFLWRTAGKPDPGISDHPFSDVKDSDFYYKAMLWAYENGVTNGTGNTTFGPKATCNRAQVVTFLYRAWQ